MLKTLITIIFLFLAFFSKAQIIWGPQNSGTSATLTYVDFISNTTGLVVGTSGTILKTTDGGNNWIKVNSGVNVDLYTVCFFDQNIAFVCGESGVILKSVNGGSTWTSMNSGTSTRLYSINFINISIGYACGLNGEIIKSSDGGVSWNKLNSGISNHLYRIECIDKDIVFVAGNIGAISRTNDGGNTWVSVSSGTSSDLSYINFYDKNLGFITGDNGTIRKTIDGGVSWTTVNSGVSIYLNNIQYIDNKTAYIVGLNGTILKTTNGGQTWVNDNSGVTDRLVSICFSSASVGYAVGLNGRIVSNTIPCLIKPVINLGNDTMYCGSVDRIINSGITGTHLWSTNETSSSIHAYSEGAYSVKVTTPENCILTDTIVLSKFENPDLGKDMSFCSFNNIVLDAGIYDLYSWSTKEITRSINVNSASKYYVTVTRGYCNGSDSINIQTLPLPQFAFIDTRIHSQINISAKNGTSPYQFSIDGINFQAIGTFTNILPGNYIIIVKDKNNCSASETIVIEEVPITIPNFFTPNGDGFHETWEIENIEAYPNAIIQIYDRFGKLLQEYKGVENGWDGTYRKLPMKSDDYWYVIDLKYGHKIYKGHVTLIR